MPYAAYKTKDDWIPLSSIRATEQAVLDWIVFTFQSVRLSEWQIIPVEIRRIRKKTKKARRR